MAKLTCLKCDRDLSQVPVVYGVLKCPECGARYSIKKDDEPKIDNSSVPGAIYGSGFVSTMGGNVGVTGTGHPGTVPFPLTCRRCGAQTFETSGLCEKCFRNDEKSMWDELLEE